MLKQRVWAALILIVAFLGALFYLPATAWALLMGAIALGAAWEWARLSGLSGLNRVLYVLLMGVTIFVFANSSDARLLQGVWWVALIFWFALAPLWLIKLWAPRRPVLLFTGLIVLLPTWFAFVSLRDIDASLLLFLMGLVWVVDSAAYFSGKQWGKHRLAPHISPGKTWEGVAGAMVVALIYVGCWHFVSPATLAHFPEAPWWGQGLAAMLLVAISITGDLFESHLKRVAGLKDSGCLIPGHGGILDRIDSQTSVLPVAMAVIYFAGVRI